MHQSTHTIAGLLAGLKSLCIWGAEDLTAIDVDMVEPADICAGMACGAVPHACCACAQKQHRLWCRVCSAAVNLLLDSPAQGSKGSAAAYIAECCTDVMLHSFVCLSWPACLATICHMFLCRALNGKELCGSSWSASVQLHGSCSSVMSRWLLHWAKSLHIGGTTIALLSCTAMLLCNMLLSST
jgi:hypothetical protein